MRTSAKIYVAGHRGLVGSAITRHLQQLGYNNLLTRTHDELDLTNQSDVDSFFRTEQPEYVFLAAARVGGILANDSYPAEFIYDNLAIQTNVLGSSYRYGVKKVLFLGSSCIYPKYAPQPISEDSLLTGTLEPTNEWYAIAKIAGIKLIQAFRKQYGLPYISVMPTNLYGPYDNFDRDTSHVLPALIRKFHEAKINNAPEVVVWGTGKPRREFLHVDDLAQACLFLMKNYDSPEPINVGTGEDLTIFELAGAIKEIIGYDGQIVMDTSKPDGTPRKLLDVSRVNALGWTAQIPLYRGIESTYEWFLDNCVSVSNGVESKN